MAAFESNVPSVHNGPYPIVHLESILQYNKTEPLTTPTPCPGPLHHRLGDHGLHASYLKAFFHQQVWNINFKIPPKKFSKILCTNIWYYGDTNWLDTMFAVSCTQKHVVVLDTNDEVFNETCNLYDFPFSLY